MVGKRYAGWCLVFFDSSHTLHIQLPGFYHFSLGRGFSFYRLVRCVIFTFRLLLAGHWHTGLSFKSYARSPLSYLSACRAVQIGITLSSEHIPGD